MILLSNTNPLLDLLLPFFIKYLNRFGSSSWPFSFLWAKLLPILNLFFFSIFTEIESSGLKEALASQRV